MRNNRRHLWDLADAPASLLDAVECMTMAQSQQQFVESSIAAAGVCFDGAVIAFHNVSVGPSVSSRHECHDPRAQRSVAQAWQRHALNSPVVRYYLAGGTDPVVATQELISDVALRNSALFSECWKPFGVRYQIGLRLWGPGWVGGLSIKRDRPFGQAERHTALALYGFFARSFQRVLELPSPVGVALSPREREVLTWLAAGKRDAEIATILGIATKTVSKHVEHILGKLGVETRTAAAATLGRNS